MNFIRTRNLFTEKGVYTCSRSFCAESTTKQSNQAQNGSVDKSDTNDKNQIPLSADDIAEPTNCCMSGCVNCVWIQYAEKLSSVLENSDADLQKIIMEKVEDPNMRSYLSMELRLRNLTK